MMNENEIAACVRKALDGYFKDLDGEKPCAIYDMVVGCVEKPLLEVVLRPAPRATRPRAAEMLGINRNTLRKKMQRHTASYELNSVSIDHRPLMTDHQDAR